MGAPTRSLHIRHSEGFDAAMYDLFVTHTRLFRAFVEALLLEWPHLPYKKGQQAPPYEFFPPELSEDRKVASLPLGGPWTIGTRHAIEDSCSYLLWRYFPYPFVLGIEEGLTEAGHTDPQRLHTNWRKPNLGSPDRPEAVFGGA